METGLPIRAHMALLDKLAADQLTDVFIQRYRLERKDLARPFPGMLELIDRLRATNVRIAVVTSKLREDALAELTMTGFDDRVDAVVAFEDTAAHKPDPAPQIQALRMLGAAGGVGVGDLPTDIASARDAGLVAFGVSWGYGSTSSLLAAGAVRVCETAQELEAGMVDWLKL